MQADLSQLGQLVEMAKTAGPVGLLTAYLLYKDLYKPWRSAKANGNGKGIHGPAYPTMNPKDFATEKDVAEMGKSLRELRAVTEAHYNDFLQRIVRVETKVDSLERDGRDDRRDDRRD